MSILDKIAEKTRERVAEARRVCPDPMMAAGGGPVLRRCDRTAGIDTRGRFFFERTLRKPGISVIAEVKKASPSKGVIAADFPYAEIARNYDSGGADCISCLTEPHWFLGKNEYLTEIRRNTDIPILRKDFTVDEYMIYEAKALGADAVLLICQVLGPGELASYLSLADDLGLSAVVEAHDESEIRTAVGAGARIIGVNNRNLRDFTVDTKNAERLRSLVPEGTLFVSESGVKSREDVRAAEEIRADAVLIGETLMRAHNRAVCLNDLAGRPPKVKICGLMREADIDAVNALMPDYAGFVFAPSRRRITREKAAGLRRRLAPGIAAVGVFADAPADEVIGCLNSGLIDIAQLHGHESDEEIRKIQEASGRRVIRAVIMKDTFPGPDAESPADYMLYDAGKGNGRTLNWDSLAGKPEKPFFLAGGLTPENAAEAVRRVHPWGVDVSSGVENADGTKSPEKIGAFIRAVRGL